MAKRINKSVIEIANKYTKVLQNNLKLDEVYLFGSFVYGKQNNDSDIDIAVISNDFSGNSINDMLKLMKLRRNIDLRIEPHPFLRVDFDVSNPFVDEIKTNGLKIF